MNFKQYLTNNILPFWLNNAIDDNYGGIFTCLDKTGEIYGTDKSVWFQGRALWTFSKAYNYIEQNKTYLDAAKKIYDFLPFCSDSDGRMFFTVTQDGRKIQKRRYYYSELFAAIGCAQYYKATGDKESWRRAENYFQIAKNCYDHPELNIPKYHISLKAHSPVMMMVSTSRAMAECAPNPEYYEALAKIYTDEILQSGFLTDEIPAFLENVSLDGKFIDTPTGRIVNPGHSLETAWFLLVEGMLTKNEKALVTGKKIIDITMPFGLDQKNGGIIAFCDALGKPATKLEWDMKLWWPQNEAIIANRMAYEIFGEEQYRKQYETLLEYAFKHFEDKEHGEWYGYLHYDSTPSTYLKGNIFKGPYHLPRMLMILHYIDTGNMIDYFK